MPTENNQELYYVYIVFISTATNMGRLIRFFTRNQYNHVSFAFDRDLSKMYSFARYRINSPILGGFVTELPHRYLHGNRDVMIKICEVPLPPAEYNRVREEVSYFLEHKDIMIYNTLNAVLSLIGKKLRVRNMFTCLEFVTYLMRYPNIFAIRELERRLAKYEVYCGGLKDTAAWEQSSANEDEFFRRRHAIGVAYDTVDHFRRVVLRVLNT